ADLGGADLREADLRGADLRGAYLREAYLCWADLSKADLSEADLSEADLRGAELYRAELFRAELFRAELNGAELSGARAGWITFGDNDLSSVKGLEIVEHLGPSTIGIDTIYKSGGKIPEVFLRGCGVPENFITFHKSLVNNPIEFYSCFISYSHDDKS